MYERLLKLYRAKTKSLDNLRKKHKAVLKKVRRLSKQSIVMGCSVGKFLNADQRKALCVRTTRGSKWSQATVKKSLQLFFSCGPTGYNALLTQKYPIPALRTLRHAMQNVKFENGILYEVFHFLSFKASSMIAEERMCCLTLDEMSITQSVEFDNRTGRFMGDVTLPQHSGSATHALVFMIGGITTRWKQTVAYFFTGNKTNGIVFADIALEIIRLCYSIGLIVIAITSDMGSANRAMWKKLGISCGRGVSCVNKLVHPCSPDNTVCVLADVPHLIKNVRNHVVNGQEIILPGSIVSKYNLPSPVISIDPIRRLVEYQKNKDLKPAPNLTEKHLQLSHFDKMKVSQALNIFSHSVSSALKLMVETEKWDSSTLTTAWFVDLMSRWFDLMSSRHPIMALSKFDADKYQAAISFLESVIEIFGQLSIGKQGAWKPVQTGVILSTMSVIDMQDTLLNKCGFKFFLTSRLTQDCLENLFSCIRSRNAIPSPLEFKNNLRLLTVAQYLKSAESGSYEIDDGCQIADFLNFKLVPNSGDKEKPHSEVFAKCQSLIEVNAHSYLEIDGVELACLYYLAGYVLSRIKKNDATCNECMTAVTASDLCDFDPVVTRLHTLKEYREGCLAMCTQAVFDLIVTSETMFRTHQGGFLTSTGNVKQFLVAEIENQSKEISFPECHAIKHKIVSRFIGARLQFFAKEQRMIRKACTDKSSKHEMSSKSMQMRKSVSKLN
jgi:hypothetical protein